MNGPEILLRVPKCPEPKTEVHVVNKCCGYKKAKPVLDGGCNLAYCPKDFYLDPLCNYPGITGLIDPDESPCILYDGQLGFDCVGAADDCKLMGYCPIDIGPPFRR